jgi:hypothetical protein
VIGRTIPLPKVLDASWKLPEVPYPEGVVQDQKSGLQTQETRSDHADSQAAHNLKSRRGGGSLRRPLDVAGTARPYQQAGAPSWSTAAFGALAIGPVKMPQFIGVLVTAGFVIVAFQPAASM